MELFCGTVELAVSKFLGAIRRYLLEGHVARKTTYGVPYWVRTDAESKVEDYYRRASVRLKMLDQLLPSPSKNPIRKAKELLITRRLEVELSKQRILELYLNSIEWGDGMWGAEAAARRYFRKSAAELSASESALLAAAIANPHILDPGHPSARLRRAAADDHAPDGGRDASAGGRRAPSRLRRRRRRRRRSFRSRIWRFRARRLPRPTGRGSGPGRPLSERSESKGPGQ